MLQQCDPEEEDLGMAGTWLDLATKQLLSEPTERSDLGVFWCRQRGFADGWEAEEDKTQRWRS